MSAGSIEAADPPAREFVGRGREIALLDAALADAMAARPRIVLLAGEPGIGKTRTAQEIAEHAAGRGMLALWGRCPEEPGAPPYWPWLQLIRRYAGQHDAAVLAETLGTAAARIAALDPELATGRGDRLPAADEHDAAKARFRLFDSIAGFWRRAAARQPLLLVLDDLHQADVPSLRLLEFLVAEAADTRLMVLGTYRDAEVSRQHPLSDTLAELPRHGAVQRLLLGGFNPAETARFVAVAGMAVGADVVAALHDRTEGHPLFLAELVRDLAQARLADASPVRLGRGRLPEGVRGAIGARLNRLTPACLHVLRTAAVFGREFRLDLLVDVLDGVAEDACRAALAEAHLGEPASTSRPTRAATSSPTPWCATRSTTSSAPPSVGRCTSGSVRRSSGRMRAISRRASRRWRTTITPRGRPAMRRKRIDYATRAAERASAMQAHEEAARHYRRADAALAAGPAGDAQRCRLLLALGDAENSAGASARALATFASAAEAARRLDDPVLLARAAIGFGDAQWRLGIEGSQTVALIARGARPRCAMADSHERAGLLTTLCQALMFANRPDDAEAAFREGGRDRAPARRSVGPTFGALCAILPGAGSRSGCRCASTPRARRSS